MDKRNIFEDSDDLFRFLFILKEFNSLEPIGGLYKLEATLRRGLASPKACLVNIISYCLNQNHYHFILEPLVEDGVQKFMHRIGTGYTMYFNEKYKRSGALFQGSYKSIHIDTNEYLLHLSVYINLNNLVHKDLNKEWMGTLPFSSLGEYVENRIDTKDDFCKKNVILDQFKNIQKYKKYAMETLPDIVKRKDDNKLLLE